MDQPPGFFDPRFPNHPVSTLLVAGETLTKDGNPCSDTTLYRLLVGALQYLTITRPELSYVVNLVSQLLQLPIEAHFLAVKRILRYFKGMLSSSLSFTSQPDLSLISYLDADWARKSCTWSAKKQSVVSHSSCESEYGAMASTASELIKWVLDFEVVRL
ncbi:uncharacterized mitochondrial protein AtMg00810-like [Andrographis paniculata]|uniref:uncharacterized mitochondrial protein AtMg00810-like n=1 Tax=Andrographis paniculata TaxID=175694 RepID=UPI0021E815EF|nr:uncharacterized mitochondrial protein AtMg00810-like [Andrographis paniculata]